VFPTLPKISIDYALLERTDRAFVVNVDCDWDDIGDWVALERLLALSDDDGSPNTVVGKHVGYEASGNIIYTEQTEDVIVTVGVSDLVVVKRGNTVLLVAKDRIADVKRVLEDERLDG
jgi:mannose-1-phosphate guanylyltransferase